LAIPNYCNAAISQWQYAVARRAADPLFRTRRRRYCRYLHRAQANVTAAQRRALDDLNAPRGNFIARRWPPSSSRFSSLFEHDLFGKPLHTFPDHALLSV